MHSLGIVQWNSTRRDHPGNPGRVSGSGPVIGTTELILILLIREYLWVLQRLSRYRSTRRYYITDTEVHSNLYSYSLFRVLSYNCLTTRPIIRNEYDAAQ